MSFFKRNIKRKPSGFQNKSVEKTNGGKGGQNLKKKQKLRDDDEILSESEDEDNYAKKTDEESSEEEETAQEKRLRMAKDYLSRLGEEAGQADDADIDQDLVANRLQRDVLEQAGRLHKTVASLYSSPAAEDLHLLRGHKLSVTCAVISADGKVAYSGSKDASLVKWDVQTLKKLHTVPCSRPKAGAAAGAGHEGHILCLALSTDGSFLASGDQKKLIYIWNAKTMERLHIFKGHRDAVSGLAFRKNSHELFSCSHDRTVKVWNVDEMGYIETLFGHQDGITGIDSLLRERAITSGGRDCTVRIWKIVEESQLVFHGLTGSIDCVALIDEEHFITGADDNSISVWHIMKKKPLVTVSNAHGRSAVNGTSDTSVSSALPVSGSKEHWISAVCALQFSDLVASGSKDGVIRLWKCGDHFKSLTELFSVQASGFVNSLAFAPDGSALVAGVGQEHRLGRWWRQPQAKNGVLVVKLRKLAPAADGVTHGINGHR